MERRKPGCLVQCKDGRIGRTYDHLPVIDGTVQVYLLPKSIKNGKELFSKVKQWIIDNPDAKDKTRLCFYNELKILEKIG